MPLLMLCADPLVGRVFAIPDKLRQTALDAPRLALIGFLFGQTQIYLNSIPQAIRRYDRTAMVESAFGIVVPLSTVGVLWLGSGLYAKSGSMRLRVNEGVSLLTLDGLWS